MLDTFEDTEREERSEMVFISVTPKVKKEIELIKDNQSLKEQIIKNFFATEKNWIEQELKAVDEATLKYSAKLITIKDKFAEVQSSYIEEVESIYNTAEKTFSKIDTITSKLDLKSEQAIKGVKRLSNAIGHINVERMERLMDAVDRFSSMNPEQKEMIELIINKSK